MSKPRAYSVKAYSTAAAKAPLAATTISRREPTDSDVKIDILYCGVCHSDLHFARNEWGFTSYPAVPGHEIIGRVSAIGRAVKKFKVGDTVGVGCLVDSCRTRYRRTGIKHMGVGQTIGVYAQTGEGFKR